MAHPYTRGPLLGWGGGQGGAALHKGIPFGMEGGGPGGAALHMGTPPRMEMGLPRGTP